jgi:hypothetical protein
MKKFFLMGTLALVLVMGCDNGTTNEDPTSKSIVITGISDDTDWAYAKIGILSSLEDYGYLSVTQFVPIVNGKTTGELKAINDNGTVSDSAWTGSGEYYVEMVLSLVEQNSGKRVLYLYTNGIEIDDNDVSNDSVVPKHDIIAATTIPFSAFKKTGEAE